MYIYIYIYSYIYSPSFFRLVHRHKAFVCQENTEAAMMMRALRRSFAMQLWKWRKVSSSEKSLGFSIYISISISVTFCWCPAVSAILHGARLFRSSLEVLGSQDRCLLRSCLVPRASCLSWRINVQRVAQARIGVRDLGRGVRIMNLDTSREIEREREVLLEILGSGAVFLLATDLCSRDA